MEVALKVNIRQLTKQLEDKLLKEPVKLPNLGVLAPMASLVVGAKMFPWVADLIRQAAEFEEEQARQRILKG